MKDGAKCCRLQKLASLGCNGEHPGNCDRDLDKLLVANPVESALFKVSLPMVTPLKQRVTAEQSLLMPHLLWAALYDSDPATFQRLFIPAGPQQVSAFWESMQVCYGPCEFTFNMYLMVQALAGAPARPNPGRAQERARPRPGTAQAEPRGLPGPQDFRG